MSLYNYACIQSTVVVELLCGSNQINSTSTPSTCHESLLQLSRDTKCSQVLTDPPATNNCEETCFRLVNNYYELCRVRLTMKATYAHKNLLNTSIHSMI